MYAVEKYTLDLNSSTLGKINKSRWCRENGITVDGLNKQIRKFYGGGQTRSIIRDSRGKFTPKLYGGTTNIALNNPTLTLTSTPIYTTLNTNDLDKGIVEALCERLCRSSNKYSKISKRTKLFTKLIQKYSIDIWKYVVIYDKFVLKKDGNIYYNRSPNNSANADLVPVDGNNEYNEAVEEAYLQQIISQLV